MKTLIRNVDLFTMDPRQPYIEDGVIAIEDNRIAYAGGAQGAPAAEAASVIDGRGRLAMPGLVNAHTHAAMTLLRGVGNDVSLQTWLFDHIFPREDRLTGGRVYWGSLLAMAEMIRSGVTSFSDMYFFMDQAARATAESGLRAVLARGIMSGDDAQEALRFDEARALVRDWNGAENGRIRAWLGPHAEYTCTEALLKKCADMAGELGVGVHVHISETRLEHQECLERHGVTPVEWMLHCGLWDVPALAAHCVHIDGEDMGILKSKGVAVAHNPGSNLKLGSGVAPVKRMLDAGLCVALGTDGAASNNDLDVWAEMYLAAVIQKGFFEDPAAMSCGQALAMATTNGAKALGIPDAGMLAQGMLADLILVERTGPHWTPCVDVAGQLVYAARGADVSMTMVDGRVLMEDREFKTLDIERIRFEAARCARELAGS